MKKFIILLVMMFAAFWAQGQYSVPNTGGTQDSIAVDTDGDGSPDTYIYPAYLVFGGSDSVKVYGDTAYIYYSFSGSESDPTLTDDGVVTIGNAGVNAQISFDVSGTDGTLLWNGSVLAINGAFDAGTNITGDSTDLNSGAIDQLTIVAVRVAGDSIADFTGAGLSVAAGSLYVTESDPSLTDDYIITVGSGASTAQIAFDVSGTDGTLLWNGSVAAFNGGVDVGTNLTADSSDINSAAIDQITIVGMRIGGDSIAEFAGIGLSVSSGQLNVDTVLLVDTSQIYKVPAFPDPYDGYVAAIDSAGDSLYWAPLAGWYWSDSSSRGPDSVLFADTSEHAARADSAFKVVSEGLTEPALKAGNIPDTLYILTYGSGGSYDFYWFPLAQIAAAGFRLPTGTNPTVDLEGEIAWDSNEDGIVGYDDTANRLIPSIMSIRLNIPSDLADDTIQVFSADNYKYPFGIKILNILVQPEDSVAASFSFAEWTDSTQSAWIDTVANVTASWKTESTTFTDSDIAANHHIRVGFDSLTVNTYIQIDYYIKTGD